MIGTKLPALLHFMPMMTILVLALSCAGTNAQIKKGSLEISHKHFGSEDSSKNLEIVVLDQYNLVDFRSCIFEDGFTLHLLGSNTSTATTTTTTRDPMMLLQAPSASTSPSNILNIRITNCQFRNGASILLSDISLHGPESSLLISGNTFTRAGDVKKGSTTQRKTDNTIGDGSLILANNSLTVSGGARLEVLQNNFSALCARSRSLQQISSLASPPTNVSAETFERAVGLEFRTGAMVIDDYSMISISRNTFQLNCSNAAFGVLFDSSVYEGGARGNAKMKKETQQQIISISSHSQFQFSENQIHLSAAMGTVSAVAMHSSSSEEQHAELNFTLQSGGIFNISGNVLKADTLGYGGIITTATTTTTTDVSGAPAEGGEDKGDKSTSRLILVPEASDGALLSIRCSSSLSNRTNSTIDGDFHNNMSGVVPCGQLSVTSSVSDDDDDHGPSLLLTERNDVEVIGPYFKPEIRPKHLDNTSNTHWASNSRVGLVKVQLKHISLIGSSSQILFSQDKAHIDGGGTSYAYQLGGDNYHAAPSLMRINDEAPSPQVPPSSPNASAGLMRVNISGDGAIFSVSPSRIIIWNNHTIFGITSISAQWSVGGGGRLLFGRGLPWSAAPKDNKEDDEYRGGDLEPIQYNNWTLTPHLIDGAGSSIGFLSDGGTKFLVEGEGSELSFFSGLVLLQVEAWSSYLRGICLRGIHNTSRHRIPWKGGGSTSDDGNPDELVDLLVTDGATVVMGGRGASWQARAPLAEYWQGALPEYDVHSAVVGAELTQNFTMVVTNHSRFDFMYGSTDIVCDLPARELSEQLWKVLIATRCYHTSLNLAGEGVQENYGLSIDQGSSLTLDYFGNFLTGNSHVQTNGDHYSLLLNVGEWSDLIVQNHSSVVIWNTTTNGGFFKVDYSAKFTLSSNCLFLLSNSLIFSKGGGFYDPGSGSAIFLFGVTRIHRQSTLIVSNLDIPSSGVGVTAWGFSILAVGEEVRGPPAEKERRMNLESRLTITLSSSILILQSVVISTIFRLAQYTAAFHIDSSSSLNLEGNFLQKSGYPMIDLSKAPSADVFIPQSNSSLILRCNWRYDENYYHDRQQQQQSASSSYFSAIQKKKGTLISADVFGPPYVVGGSSVPLSPIPRAIMSCSSSCRIGSQGLAPANSFCFAGAGVDVSYPILQPRPIVPSRHMEVNGTTNYSVPQQYFSEDQIIRTGSSSGSGRKPNDDDDDSPFAMCHCSKCPESALSYPVAPGPFCLPLLPAPTPLHPTLRKHVTTSAPTQAPNIPQAPHGSLKTWMIVLIVLGSLLLFACLLHLVLHGVAILLKKRKMMSQEETQKSDHEATRDLEQGLLSDEADRDNGPHSCRGQAIKNRRTSCVSNQSLLDWSVRPSAVNFRKGKLIGSGGFGRVYIGLDDISGRLLAAKEINLADDPDREAKARELDHEIDMMRQLDHANVVQYLGADQLGPCEFYIFMEFLPGGSLRSIINSFGSLNQRISAKYTLQALEGLRYLHSRRVVHRDIKSANMLLDRDGVLKLADMGSAQSFTSVASMRGTPYWMAPEVIKVGCDIGPASDVWSLGGTVVEMLTGRIPFEWLGADYQVMNYLSMAEDDGTGDGDAGDGVREGGRLDMWGKAPDVLKEADPGFDFVKQCCQLDPKKRPTIEKLLEHPFVLLANTSDENEQSTRYHSSSAGESGGRGGGIFPAASASEFLQNWSATVVSGRRRNNSPPTKQVKGPAGGGEVDHRLLDYSINQTGENSNRNSDNQGDKSGGDQYDDDLTIVSDFRSREETRMLRTQTNLTKEARSREGGGASLKPSGTGNFELDPDDQDDLDYAAALQASFALDQNSGGANAMDHRMTKTTLNIDEILADVKLRLEEEIDDEDSYHVKF